MADNGDARRRNVLLGLFVVAVAVAGWQYRDALMPGDAGAAAPGLVISDPRIQQLAALPEIPVERQGTTREYSPRRNLFDFAPDPVAVEAERRRREQRRKLAEERKQKEEKRRQAARARKQARAASGEKPLPPPPSFSYTYVGYARPVADERGFIAFLVKKGAKTPRPVPVRVGDIVDDKFVVKRIDLDQVVIGYTDERYRGRTKAVKLVPKRTSGKKR